jgi:AraC-like DNA-binding protein
LIPEPGNTSLSFSSFIILLGVVQGTLLMVTGLLRSDRSSRLKGFLFLSITCIIAEIFLNRTGYMYHVIWLVDFSEPVQYAIAPLAYLIIVCLNPDSSIKNWWLHFIPFILYLLYFIPFYFASPQYKEASYYFIHHLVNFQDDGHFNFLMKWGRLRNYQLYLCFFQTTVYMVLCFQLLSGYKKQRRDFPVIDQREVNWWLLFNILMGMLVMVVLVVKVTFVRDLGDHIIASFFTFIIYFATFFELTRLSRPHRVSLEVQAVGGANRNISSGVKEEKKDEIQARLMELMEEKRLYRDSLISLSRVAKQAGEPAYVVSQVINERMGASFFEWIAKYRVEEAKKMLADPSARILTIEQIAEAVGYNSKSAFNKVFKKFTGKTPSEYKITE